jgi:hypothetical protein
LRNLRLRKRLINGLLIYCCITFGLIIEVVSLRKPRWALPISSSTKDANGVGAAVPQLTIAGQTNLMSAGWSYSSCNFITWQETNGAFPSVNGWFRHSFDVFCVDYLENGVVISIFWKKGVILTEKFNSCHATLCGISHS